MALIYVAWAWLIPMHVLILEGKVIFNENNVTPMITDVKILDFCIPHFILSALAD